MTLLNDRKGFIKPLILLLLLAAGIYAAYQFGMPYYRYEAFKSDVKEIVRLELGNPEKTRAEVFKAAESFEIPVEEKDIVVTRKENSIRVAASWSVDVDLLGLYQKRLEFEIDTEE